MEPCGLHQLPPLAACVVRCALLRNLWRSEAEAGCACGSGACNEANSKGACAFVVIEMLNQRNLFPCVELLTLWRVV